MRYYKNYLGSVYDLSIVLSSSEICCFEPFVVQSLLRFNGKSINLYLDSDGSLHIDTFFSDYDTRENFCKIMDAIISSSHTVFDSTCIANDEKQ